jgi:uncharacterized delta-60 repeat protein
MKNTFTIILVIMVLCGSVFGQYAGDHDLTFNGTGKLIYDNDFVDLYKDVQVQSDGKIIAVGTSIASTYMTSTIVVSRLLSNGTFDPSFGTNGHFVYSQDMFVDAAKCIIKDNGKILIGGMTTDYATYEMLVMQLDENGNLDPDFGVNGVVKVNSSTYELAVSAMALQGSNILLGGYARDADYRDAPVLLRLSETGELDTSFGVNGIATVPVTEVDNEFSAVSIQSDGKIVAAGHISNGMSWFSLLIARFDQDGNIDSTYATNGLVNLNLNNVDDEFYDMKLLDNDDAILTGFTVDQANFNYHLLVMKFDANGSPDSSFGVNSAAIYGDVAYTFGDAMVIQPGGKILISGSTGELPPGNNDWALWRFNSDGSLDNTFGAGGITITEFFGNADEALGIVLHADKIILAGKTRNTENKLDFAVAQYWNDINVSVPEVAAAKNFSVSPNPVTRNNAVNLTYELKQSETISIELVNTTGKVVMSLPIGLQAEGNHSYQLNLPSSITGGVYFLKMKGDHYNTNTCKVIVID